MVTSRDRMPRPAALRRRPSSSFRPDDSLSSRNTYTPLSHFSFHRKTCVIRSTQYIAYILYWVVKINWPFILLFIVFLFIQAPRPEVVLVLSRNRSVSPQDICHDVDKDLPPVMIPASNTGLLGNPRTSHILMSGNGSGISRPPRILESPSDFTNYDPGKLFGKKRNIWLAGF